MSGKIEERPRKMGRSGGQVVGSRMEGIEGDSKVCEKQGKMGGREKKTEKKKR